MKNNNYKIKTFLNFMINKLSLNENVKYNYFLMIRNYETNLILKNNKFYNWIGNVNNVNFYLNHIFIKNLKIFDSLDNSIIFHKIQLLIKSSLLIFLMFLAFYLFLKYKKYCEFKSIILKNNFKSTDLEKDLLINKIFKNDEIHDKLIKNVSPLIYGNNLTLLTMNGIIKVLYDEVIKNDTYKLVNKNLLVNNILNKNEEIENDLKNLFKKIFTNKKIKMESLDNLNNFLKSYTIESVVKLNLVDTINSDFMKNKACETFQNLTSNYINNPYLFITLNSYIINYLESN